ncbi:14335_t:CDS:2, partial [Funneliformis mosseae]
GNVIAYEMPGNIHSVVSGGFGFLIESWSNRLLVNNELDITVGDNSEYCADVAVVPKELTPHGSALLQPHKFYWNLSCNKNIYSPTDGTAAMLALLHLRNNQIPNPALDTRNPPPNAPSMITLPNTIPNIAISFENAPLNHQPATFLHTINVPFN